MTASLARYIPSPPTNGIPIGPVRLHFYGFMIALGIAAAIWLAQRRWEAIGGRSGTMSALAVWGVPGGLIGARVYSLATSWSVDTQGHWYWAFEIWRGGLGIWGGVVGGILLGAVGVWRAHLPLGPVVDCVAPAFALAQAIGRWGNYFNQELYGWRSNLPWAVKIDHPAGYTHAATFQPTFLYESVWDLIVVALVIWIERRSRIRRGYLVFTYAACYTFGRFFTEWMRIDTAHRFLGMRLNDWTSVLVFAFSLSVLLVWGRAGPGQDRAGDPLPAFRAGRHGTAVGSESGPAGPESGPAGPDPSGPRHPQSDSPGPDPSDPGHPLSGSGSGPA